MCEICQNIENLQKTVKDLEERFEKIERNLSKGAYEKESYTVKEFAELIGRSAYTVSEMCRSGKVKAKQLTKSGNYIIPKQSVLDFFSQI